MGAEHDTTTNGLDKLQHGQQSAEDADGGQSNDSTHAVQLGNAAGASRQNSADDLDG